jgi:hypothetical protein
MRKGEEMKDFPNNLTEAFENMVDHDTPELGRWIMLALILHEYGLALGIDLDRKITEDPE